MGRERVGIQSVAEGQSRGKPSRRCPRLRKSRMTMTMSPIGSFQVERPLRVGVGSVGLRPAVSSSPDSKLGEGRGHSIGIRRLGRPPRFNRPPTRDLSGDILAK